jgi:hypothetical protein
MSIALPTSSAFGMCDNHWGTVFIVDTTKDTIDEYNVTTGKLINSISGPNTNTFDVAYFNGALVVKDSNTTTAYIYGQPWSTYTYHNHLIRKDSDGSIDAGFDTSVSAANIPTGYTAYRRIGSVITDGSANILAFKQIGDRFYHKTAIRDVATTGTLPGSSPTKITLTVPTGLETVAMLYTHMRSSNERRLWIYAHDYEPNYSPTIAYNTIGTNGGATQASTYLEVIADSAAQITHQSDGNTGVDSYELSTRGWIDDRGKLGGA